MPSQKRKRPSNDEGRVNSHTQNAGEKASVWQPPKTKKTDEERSISFVGAVVPPQLKHNMDDSFARDREVLRKGPNGSPVYDRLGYKINYQRLKRSSRRVRRTAAKSLALVEAESQKDRRVREIMELSGGSHSGRPGAFQDKVARDLDIPYHTVDLPEYEEWHRRGFRLEPGELEGKPSEEESERLFNLMLGSAFRE